MGEDVELLEDHPEAAAAGLDGPGARGLEAFDAADEGALAAAGGADDGNDLSRTDFQADVPQGGHPAGVHFGKMGYADHFTLKFKWSPSLSRPTLISRAMRK